MATISQIPKGVMLPQGAAPRMDPGARGFRVNLGEVIQSSQATRIDGRAFAAGAMAGAAIGEALGNVGQAGMAVAKAQLEMVNRRKVLEADGMMVQRETDIARLIAEEPDEMKWPVIAEREAKASEKLWLTNDLSPDAAEAVAMKSMAWRSRLVSQAGDASIGRSRQNLASEYEKRRLMAVEAGDIALANAQTDEAEAAGLLRPDVAQRQRMHTKASVDAAQEQARRDLVVGEAADAPDDWLAKNPEPGRMDIGDWRAGQDMARDVIRTRTTDAASELGDAFATGDIKSEADIERVAGGRLSPAALAEAKEDLRKMQSDAWRAENLSEKGVTKNFGLLLSEVEKYDKAADADGSKYASLVWRIKTALPEELRGEVTGPLARKWNPGDGPDAPEPLRGFVRETLRNWYDDGKFGVTKKQVPMSPEDPGYWQSTTKTKTVDDPPARDAAAVRRGQAEMEMSKWLKANPGASIKEAKDQLLRASSAALLPGDVNTLLRKPPPPPADVDVPRRLKEMGLKFGGVSIPATGDLGAARTTVFGGPNDPADNGLSAFGGETGDGGKEGVAVPEKILRHFYGDNRADWERVQVEATLPDGKKQVLPIADLGTAEWVWKRDGKPVVDLTPGAVEQLGGDVIYGKRGTLKGAKGLAGVTFRLLPLDNQKPPFDS
jgi:hypothetical protein